MSRAAAATHGADRASHPCWVWPDARRFGRVGRSESWMRSPQMSAESAPAPETSPMPRAPDPVNGLLRFAGTLMVIRGGFHSLVGIAALVDDKIYVTTPNYIYSADVA